jgi:carbon storage regulator
MLVLSRSLNEAIKIGDNVTITIVEILKDRVKLGITAPPNIRVFRAELLRQPPKEKNSHGLERPNG